ncbi:Putative Duf814 domain containing protein [[Torrubiella] hemipterigena]|uniref:Putative Duf814 domain containing protein n=1 Tax=[Torrubiella] hemipterigena TaxID=1531966 RepID=A0A0A1T8L0_9HYPO|nr:Putative Duf814 domain containing protein [[Torrubiella] hemipterigena]
MSLLSMQHHPHHQQGPPPPQQLHTSRPSSVVHQQQHSSQTQTQSQSQSQSQAQTTQASHSPYQSNTSNNHSITQAYQSASQTPNPQDSLNNYYSHPSPYSTPGATGGYTSAGADTADMMAATQMPRAPYPPMSYHTPQSNSPASVASPSQHDQHRSIYGQQASQHMAPSMYYQPHHQYQPIHPHPSASPYAQHAHHPQQPMTSQPNMMLSHSTPQNHMAQQQQQHQGHHAAHHQQQQQHAPQQHQQHHPQHPQHAQAHAQGGMNNSPRPKMENQLPLQLSKQPQASLNGGHPQQHQQQQQQQQMQSPGGAGHPGGIHPNAAPGPIPATTPLVVRQDGNGVQWIAFEYSRDRVKMEYTIRCDVESVNTDELAADFKQENCVYPRACCPKEQYRGNRLTYETECNRVGWALAQLNGSLRGKRGLIQRAVDSWRNSNQDVRLRSRRVRRMAKMTTRKHGQPNSHSASPHMPGHPSPASLASVPGSLGGPITPLDTKIMNPMGQPMHHHATGHPGAGHSAGGEVDLFHHM